MVSGSTANLARGLRTLWNDGHLGSMEDASLVARFAARRDEAAFEILVARHGPMVLRVAADVLGDRDSAHDAFQATFLVLARKAGSIARPEALGAWLHGVALRVARKARSEAERRRWHELRAAERSPREVAAEVDRHDLGPALHEEVARLSEPCRVAVDLCCFRGMTYEEAARHLGVSESTVRGRLARARRTLRGRLSRRDNSGLVAPLVLSDRLVGLTARAASRFVAGQESTPVAVAGLAEGVLRAMILNKIKLLSLLVALPFVAAAGGLGQEPVKPTPDLPGPARPRPDVEGLTLNEALKKSVVSANFRPRFLEIPEARFNVLAAPFVADPAYYADDELVVYQFYSTSSPGKSLGISVKAGPPVSIIRKRGSQPTKVLEAQYQDAVRLLVERVSTTFVDAMAARDLRQLRRVQVEKTDRLADESRRLGHGDEEARQIERARASAVSGREKADESLGRALVALASLLPSDGGKPGSFEVAGDLDSSWLLEPSEKLVAQGRAGRPDLIACQLGLDRALSDLKLVEEVTQVNPILTRDVSEIVGNNRRARVNVSESQFEVHEKSQRVVAEVEQAWRDCSGRLDGVREAKKASKETRRLADEAWSRFLEGRETATDVLAALDREAEAARLRVEATATARRGRVALNAAVGRRVMP